LVEEAPTITTTPRDLVYRIANVPIQLLHKRKAAVATKIALSHGKGPFNWYDGGNLVQEMCVHNAYITMYCVHIKTSAAEM
jgi:hypothetical protein